MKKFIAILIAAAFAASAGSAFAQAKDEKKAAAPAADAKKAAPAADAKKAAPAPAADAKKDAPKK